jgi:hypothetical protein
MELTVFGRRGLDEPDPAALAVFMPEHPRPAYALKDGSEVLNALKSARNGLSQ